jgi:hypothetical protein
MSHHSTPILLSLPKLTLLGPPQSEVRNIRKMFFFGGDKIYVKFVEHLSDFETFFEEMQNVKAVIRDLSHLWGGRHISVEEYMERTRREWLHGVVRSFVSKYGENSVSQLGRLLMLVVRKFCMIGLNLNLSSLRLMTVTFCSCHT